MLVMVAMIDLGVCQREALVLGCVWRRVSLERRRILIGLVARFKF